MPPTLFFITCTSNSPQKIIGVSDKAMKKIRAYANNVYQESMICYHEDNQYTDTKKAEGYTRLITDEKLFVINESKKSIKYFQEDSQSLAQALPTSSTRISNRQISLIFGFMGTAFMPLIQSLMMALKQVEIYCKEEKNTRKISFFL
jgi:hypothetical protein